MKKSKNKWSEINKWLKENNLTEEDLDFMWEACKAWNHKVISHLNDWRDLNSSVVRQIPDVYEKMVDEIIYN